MKIRKIIPLVLAICVSAQATSIEVREPVVAGQFYPSDSAELKKMVTAHLAAVPNSVKDEIKGQIIALIVPHAGLVYSGPIAAYGYKLLENSGINKVIICGPSHHFGFQGISVYGPVMEWLTPLGLVPCNDTLCNGLLAFNKKIAVIPDAFAKEHSVEVQLPYLQTVLKNFRIAPMIMGYQDPETIALLARGLEALPFDNKTVMIASSDWQHYRPASVGSKMDSIGMECISNLDPDRLERYLKEGKTELCGGGPVVSIMKAAIARGANRAKILKYGDSGDLTGDKSQVVGYVAAVLYKSDNAAPQKPIQGKVEVKNDMDLASKYGLSEANKKELLRIARESIKSYLNNRTIPDFTVPEDLKKFGAAFVTLTEGGDLRGCIGHTSAVEPLYETVAYCAVQAATADPRFRPMVKEELEKVQIEISVLTPMEKVTSPDEIKIGRDGLMIFKGDQRGLLLPQVATEYGWSVTEFLEQTCRKAGLPPDAYKSAEAILYRFQAVIFDE